MFRFIPNILYVLPSLEYLRCECVREEVNTLAWRHISIRDIVLDMSQMRFDKVEKLGLEMIGLTLFMPRLVQVKVVEPTRRMVVVASSEYTPVNYTLV